MMKVQACLLSALLVSGVALAQDSSQAPTADPAQTHSQSAGSVDSSQPFMTEQTANQVRSEQLVGSDVVNTDNDKIGSISDLVINKEGQVVGIVVGVGGFLGMGEKQVALSWNSVKITTDEDNDNYQVMTSLLKGDLESAIEYTEHDK